MTSFEVGNFGKEKGKEGLRGAGHGKGKGKQNGSRCMVSGENDKKHMRCVMR